MTTVEFVGPEHYQAWERYVFSHRHGGPYLSLAWREAVERGYGHRAFYLAAFQGAELKGVLPLFLLKPPLPGCRGALVSLPFCDYGGVLADCDGIAHALLARATELAREVGAGLEIRSAVELPALAQAGGGAQVADKCRMLLTLPGSAALLWDGFKSKLRSQIKKAGRDGLLCRLGGIELFLDFYQVFSRNMRDLGSPVHAEGFLRSVLAAYGERARVGVVWKEDTPAAAGIILSHGGMVTIPWASALREFNRFSPNMLLYWTLLEYAAESGFACFDFGRSTPGEGTYKFKEQWGAVPAPLFWWRFVPPGEGRAPAASGEKSRSLRGCAEWCWQRLPLPVANSVGPLLRKYVSL